MLRALSTALALSLTAVLTTTTASAATLFSLSTTQGSDNTGDDTEGPLARYDSSAVTLSVDSSVGGPTLADITSDGSDGNGIGPGLQRFWNNAGNGGWFSMHAGGQGNTVGDFDSGYFAFTITANPGELLNLDSVAFKSSVFTANDRRGYEFYGEVNGGSFDASDLIFDQNDENETRGTGDFTQQTEVLTGNAKYQGVESVTFRLYLLTDLAGRTVDFDDFEITGTTSVIPEPASLVLLGLGGLCVMGRRRR